MKKGRIDDPALLVVIASEAKQSILRHNGWMDRFVAMPGAE
jgi:hypothetical protein